MRFGERLLVWSWILSKPREAPQDGKNGMLAVLVVLALLTVVFYMVPIFGLILAFLVLHALVRRPP